MEDSQLPSPAGTQLLVDVRGAEIVSSHSEECVPVFLSLPTRPHFPGCSLPGTSRNAMRTTLILALDLSQSRGVPAAPRRDDLAHRHRRALPLLPGAAPSKVELTSFFIKQIGGSLAKVVYFTRAPAHPTRPVLNGNSSSSTSDPLVDSPSQPSSPASSSDARPAWEPRRTPSPPQQAKPNGILGPKSLAQQHRPAASSPSASSRAFQSHLRRRSSNSRIPSGGRLNFTKFETSDLSSLISYLETLISSSAQANRVPVEVMKRNVKIMATGGGAQKFHEQLHDALGIEVRREEEMECLVLGLSFVMEIPNEVFWYSDELIQAVSHPQQRALSAVNLPSTPRSSASPLPLFPGLDTALAAEATPQLPPAPPPVLSHPDELPRPSPNPPQYSIKFDSSPTPAQFPCLLVNIGSGVSIIKIDDYGKFERISGTSLGGGTLWGLLSLLTGAKSFDGASRHPVALAVRQLALAPYVQSSGRSIDD